ncbi:MAG: hypothetical protein WCI05_07100, partial [Myxococcales bacterium]
AGRAVGSAVRAVGSARRAAGFRGAGGWFREAGCGEPQSSTAKAPPRTRSPGANAGIRLALRSAPVLMFLLAVVVATGCNSDAGKTGSTETVARTSQQVWANGDFETGDPAAPPPSWTVRNYLNANGGVKGTPMAPPQSFDALNLGDKPAFRYPLYGRQAVRVNYMDDYYYGDTKNANALVQTMSTTAADIDPMDGKIHVRFAMAPVLENPSHKYNEQPFYFVQVDNLTTRTKLYGDFNVAGQAGVPWKSTEGVNWHYGSKITTVWTDWQLVDVTGAINVGDSLQLTILASGCSKGAHVGRVYVDGVGSTVPGPFASATGPAAATANSDITYTVHYANGGTTDVWGAHVDMTTPPNTTFQSVNSAPGTCTTPTVGQAGSLSCFIGTLAPKASGSFTVTVHINPGATGSITNGIYAILGTNTAPLQGPKVVTRVSSGSNSANLAASQTASAPVATAGGTITYTTVITNNGPATLGAAAVQVSLPKPTQITSWTYSCVAASGATCGVGATCTTGLFNERFVRSAHPRRDRRQGDVLHRGNRGRVSERHHRFHGHRKRDRRRHHGPERGEQHGYPRDPHWNGVAPYSEQPEQFLRDRALRPARHPLRVHMQQLVQGR